LALNPNPTSTGRLDSRERLAEKPAAVVIATTEFMDREKQHAQLSPKVK
jgi:hypothetical protein